MKAEVKLTPGKWRWFGRKSWTGHFSREGVTSENGVNVFSVSEYAGSAWIEVSDEDARLIESAPDLLEALKYIAKTWPDDFAARHARAAIAKAEGRS